jgi:4-hydroxymandelate oxidase
MNSARFTRRRAAAGFASWLAASPLLRGHQLAGEPPGRIAPADELANTFEFEAMARRKLDSIAFSQIADSGRPAFDRMTLRPRMMVNALKLDLTTELFGEKMFTPILAGPVADQKRFHADGEIAAAQGASAAKTVIVISSRASFPLAQIAAQSKASWWYQAYPEPGMDAVRARIDKAVDLGCKAVCVTVGAPDQGNPGLDWDSLDRLKRGIHAPVLLKGIMNPEEARVAVERGFAGIVVSNHGAPLASGLAEPIEMLPAIADAVGGKVPVLVDGGFRRGTDVLKALALGARAVLLGRPPVWGLAAYGADGVQILLRMLQAELARNMAMCGKVTVGDIDRSLVTIHRR